MQQQHSCTTFTSDSTTQADRKILRSGTTGTLLAPIHDWTPYEDEKISCLHSEPGGKVPASLVKRVCLMIEDSVRRPQEQILCCQTSMGLQWNIWGSIAVVLFLNLVVDSNDCLHSRLETMGSIEQPCPSAQQKDQEDLPAKARYDGPDDHRPR